MIIQFTSAKSIAYLMSIFDSLGEVVNLQQQLAQFPRLDLVGTATPLEKLSRLSDYLGREIYLKRDDVTPMAMGGNKLRKLEFLAADALRQGADTLVTAGAIQSNHVRQTAAVAAKLGLHCVALLENPIDTRAENYLTNGNRLLLGLFNAEVVMCEALHDPQQQLAELATRLEAQGFRPYVVPVGGSNALGALGYVQCALKSPSRANAATWRSVRWWWRPAAPAPTPGWRWGCSSCCRKPN